MCVEDRPKPVVFVETVSASAAGVNTFQSLVFVCSLLCAAGGVSAATALHSALRGPPQRVQHSNGAGGGFGCFGLVSHKTGGWGLALPLRSKKKKTPGGLFFVFCFFSCPFINATSRGVQNRVAVSAI